MACISLRLATLRTLENPGGDGCDHYVCLVTLLCILENLRAIVRDLIHIYLVTLLCIHETQQGDVRNIMYTSHVNVYFMTCIHENQKGDDYDMTLCI